MNKFPTLQFLIFNISAVTSAIKRIFRMWVSEVMKRNFNFVSRDRFSPNKLKLGHLNLLSLRHAFLKYFALVWLPNVCLIRKTWNYLEKLKSKVRRVWSFCKVWFLQHFALYYAFTYAELVHNYPLYIHVPSNFRTRIVHRHLVVWHTRVSDVVYSQDSFRGSY